MAHGMASGKKFIGASAVFAAAAEFVFRSYNIAFPEFDMGRADDLFVFSPESKKISRLQIRGKQTEILASGNDGGSTPIYMPMEVVDADSSVDYALMALRYKSSWLLGLFDNVYFQTIVESGVGCKVEHVGQITFDPKARVELETGRVLFSGFDVSEAFSHNKKSKWDELFPIRNSQVKKNFKPRGSSNRSKMTAKFESGSLESIWKNF